MSFCEIAATNCRLIPIAGLITVLPVILNRSRDTFGPKIKRLGLISIFAKILQHGMCIYLLELARILWKMQSLQVSWEQIWGIKLNPSLIDKVALLILKGPKIQTHQWVLQASERLSRWLIFYADCRCMFLRW